MMNFCGVAAISPIKYKAKTIFEKERVNKKRGKL